jgi:hypothetical protein
VVAGSNPVSPTEIHAGQRPFWPTAVRETATPGGYVAQRTAQRLSSSPTGVMMQAVIMRDEVAVVTVLPGGKGHRSFDPSRADISWRTDDKTGR